MKNFEIILLIIIVLILIITTAWTFIGFMNPKDNDNFSHSEENFQEALSSEIVDDICTAPPGYSQEEWESHMSHHPDRYAECLK